MPTNKRRARHGYNSTTTATTSPSSLQNAIKANGIAYNNNLNHTNNNDINHHHHHHHLNKIGNGITTTGTATATTAVGTGPISQLTLKQQQQLDRNAYLSTLTKYQLQIECRKRGQKTNGTKAELVFKKLNKTKNKLLLCFLTTFFFGYHFSFFHFGHCY